MKIDDLELEYSATAAKQSEQRERARQARQQEERAKVTQPLTDKEIRRAAKQLRKQLKG